MSLSANVFSRDLNDPSESLSLTVFLQSIPGVWSQKAESMPVEVHANEQLLQLCTRCQA